MNDALRAAIAADLAPVRPLASPLRRSWGVVPIALLLLFAAPVVFDFRNLALLGWGWSWGASIGEMVLGVAVVAMALADAIPGRERSGYTLLAFALLVLLLLLAVTIASWQAAPVAIARGWWQIAAMCGVASVVSALPAIVLSAVLIDRAFPLHPARTGALAGCGGGLLADAGWRLFCHFSEPQHVVAAHVGGVVAASVLGAFLTLWLARHRRITTSANESRRPSV